MEKDFHFREEKIEENANTLDKYDSFYHETRSLLVLFQIMGVVPISRTHSKHPGVRTTFSWFSQQSLWAYFVYTMESIVVIMGKFESVFTFTLEC